MKRILSVVWVLIFASITHGAIQTEYPDFKKYTDFDLSSRSKETTLKIFERELQESKKLNAAVADDQTLAIIFKDINLAGEMLPNSGYSSKETRVIKGIFPPRLVFRYILADSNGVEITSGDISLSDPSFQFDISRNLDARTFYYEIKLLEDWANKAFR